MTFDNQLGTLTQNILTGSGSNATSEELCHISVRRSWVQMSSFWEEVACSSCVRPGVLKVL